MNDVTPERFLSLVSDRLEAEGSVEFSPHGESMSPTLRDGDTVTLVKAKSVRKYDVILYRRPNGKAVLHRVIAVKDGAFVTRGDAQWQPEFNVRPESVVALAIAYTRGKKTSSLGKTPSAVMINAYNACRRFFRRALNKLTKKSP